MLYFNEKSCSVEQEQLSIVLGKDFVITFQEDAKRDVFNSRKEMILLKRHVSSVRDLVNGFIKVKMNYLMTK